MSSYIKAELALNHTIIYTDDTGRYFRLSGGTWAWRNHNPGNLVPGKVSARHNQIGSTGKFAIFPDYENGHLALIDCLQTTYANKSIDDLVKDYAPAKDGNNVKKYRKFLHDKTGVDEDKKVKDFTEEQFDKLWRAIEQMEGYQEGDIIEVFPVIQAHKNKSGIHELNVKTKGWFSKSECIKLAKRGELDLIVCTAHTGNDYLRARNGSSVNGSLDDLVIKYNNKEK
jgi:ribosomal protein S13